MADFDLFPLDETERSLRDAAHRFARDLIRPAAAELDRMPPEQRVGPDSPYFRVLRAFKEQGFHRIGMPAGASGDEEPPSTLARYLIYEELGWGSLGLGTALGVDGLPFALAAMLGDSRVQAELVRPWLEDTAGRYHGCWGVTEPDHGSDYLLFAREPDVAGFGRGNVQAVRDGDDWRVSGQKAAWVSSAPVATHCALHAQVRGSEDLARGVLLVVPLDSEGVSRGPVMDMLGARDDPQGELFFDNVRVPGHYALVPEPDFYRPFMDQLLCLTSVGLGAMCVGVARAAWEEALGYAQQRIQGGVPLTHHKNIRLKLYAMFEKVETARAYVRAAMAHVHGSLFERRSFDASPPHARAAQIYAKRVAFEVAHEAVQVFGAAGLAGDSLVQKLFRDARCALIEDGTLEVLALDAVNDLVGDLTPRRGAAGVRAAASRT